MDNLNSKVVSGQEEVKFSAQNVGLYGYDSTTDGGTWRRLVCDAEGKQKIEATLELDSSTLAKDATLTNGTQLSRCMGIDTATSLQHQLKVESDGALHVITENADSVLIKGVDSGAPGVQRDCKQNANGDLRTQLIGNDGNDGAGTMRIIKCDANGELAVNFGSSTTQNVNCLGNEVGDGSGAVKHLHLDGSGNVQANVVNTINISPSNDTNGHITDDPANSVAVALTGRQTIGTATTQTFLKCNASGELLTSGGGGGGSASNQYNNGGSEETLSVIAPTGPATSEITPATTILDMTNYKGLQVNITTTSASYFDISVGVEFSNSATFLTTLGVAYFDIQTFNSLTDVGGNPVAGLYGANVLMTPEFNSQQPQARYARATFNHNNNTGSNISVVINTIQMPF